MSSIEEISRSDQWILKMSKLEELQSFGTGGLFGRVKHADADAPYSSLSKLEDQSQAQSFTSSDDYAEKSTFELGERFARQAQNQTNKSFWLSAVACTVSLSVTVSGVACAFKNPSIHFGLVIALGAIAQLSSAFFFYLHNKTVLKMSDDYAKRLLAQNVYVALKIIKLMPNREKVEAQASLVKELSKNINRRLSAPIGAKRTATHKSKAGIRNASSSAE